MITIMSMIHLKSALFVIESSSFSEDIVRFEMKVLRITVFCKNFKRSYKDHFRM